MPRKKKVLKEEIGPVIDSTAPKMPIQITVKQPIAPLALDFGRDDLNALAAKLNEVIERIN